MKTLFPPSFTKRTSLLIYLSFTFGVIFFSCQKDDVTPQENASTEFPAILAAGGPCFPAPVFSNSGPGGNADCPNGYEYTSGRFNIDQSLPYPQGGTFGPITWQISADGKFLSWSGNVCGLVVIVKGGPASNIYTFAATCGSGSGLRSPSLSNGNTPRISNITFCWNECPTTECNNPSEPETGFGGDSEGESQQGGNQGWWYYFDTQGPACQKIYVGQQEMNGGSVCYNAGTGVLAITLGPKWILKLGANESVKVQGYNIPPSNRPPAGQFTTYKGTSLTVAGNGSRYYVIHLDVQYCN